MDALVRMANERFEDLSTRVHGNLQYSDIAGNTKQTIDDNAEETAQDVVDNTPFMQFENVQLSKEDGLRIDTVLTSGGVTASLYFKATGTQIGLYRTLDDVQVWGGKLLSDGTIVTVTSALIDPTGDGSSVFLVKTIDGATLLSLSMNSYEGATDEVNPVSVGRLDGLNIGAWNAKVWQTDSYEDDFYSYLHGKGLFDIRSVDGQLSLSALNGLLIGAIASDLWPDTTGVYNLGNSSDPLRWRRLYCTESVDISSDARLKQDIKDINTDLIMHLRPRQYRLIADPEKLQYGLIAQEVKEALDECGIENADLYGDENPDSLSLRYEQLIAPLIAAFQAEHRRNDALELRLSALERKINGGAS